MFKILPRTLLLRNNSIHNLLPNVLLDMYVYHGNTSDYVQYMCIQLHFEEIINFIIYYVSRHVYIISCGNSDNYVCVYNFVLINHSII